MLLLLLSLPLIRNRARSLLGAQEQQLHGPLSSLPHMLALVLVPLSLLSAQGQQQLHGPSVPSEGETQPAPRPIACYPDNLCAGR